MNKTSLIYWSNSSYKIELFDLFYDIIQAQIQREKNQDQNSQTP